jgi:hypothetical protein
VIVRDPEKTAVRTAQSELRLGVGAACAFCGERSLEVLREATDPKVAAHVREVLLERHHVLGRAHDPKLRILLCLNCHARTTEGQLRNAVPMQPQDNFLYRLRAALQSVAAFLEEALAAVERWLKDLDDFISFLDTKCPTWLDLWRNRK